MSQPKVKITVEGGLVIGVESSVPLDVQIIDEDAHAVGETWLEELRVPPTNVIFEEPDSIVVSADEEI